VKQILLVYPKIPSTYWSFNYSLPFVGKKSLMPPLGLMTVASMIPENFKLKLVDLNVEELDVRDVIDSDLVFLSAMIVQKESFQEVVEICNENFTKVVAGGPYPTSSFNEIEGVDYFVINEGEITIPKFFEDYKNGNLKKIYTSSEKPDLTKTPPPRFDLIDMSLYSTMAIQASRGCPFNCEFCDIIEMFGRKPRYKTPEQFLREMDVLFNLGFKGPLFIVDDNFIGNKKQAKALLREIIKWQEKHENPFTLFTEASINLAEDDEFLDLMVAAGFNMVFIGIETPDPETLKATQKTQNMKGNLLDSVLKIQNRGIEVLAGFIIGFDTDKDDIFDRQIEFIQEAGIPMAMIGLMMVLPNTQLWRRLEKENRLRGATHGNNTHELVVNFEPIMDEKKMVDGYRRIISTIYTPKNYFKRAETLIERIPAVKFEGRKILKEDVKALFLSLLKQGFSKYAFSYWKFIFKTIFRNPQNLPLSFSISVKGYHFFKITKEINLLNNFMEQLEEVIPSLEKVFYNIKDLEKPENLVYIENKINFQKNQIQNAHKKLPEELKSKTKKKVKTFYGDCNQLKIKWIEKSRNLREEKIKNISSEEYLLYIKEELRKIS